MLLLLLLLLNNVFETILPTSGGSKDTTASFVNCSVNDNLLLYVAVFVAAAVAASVIGHCQYFAVNNSKTAAATEKL